MDTTAVLLAAGGGARLGRGPKALLPFRGGLLVEHCVRELHRGGCTRVVVVVGADAAAVRCRANLGAAAVVVNPGWAEGMGTSFRCGVAAATGGRPLPDYLLLAVVDQPGLTAASVQRVLASAAPGRISAAAYALPGAAPRRGHPVLFPVHLARRAAAMASGDSGARTFLAQNPGLVDLVDCSGAGDGRDVDVAADLFLLDAAADRSGPGKSTAATLGDS